jgi:diacylglycerol kinase (ATP)
MPLPFQHALLVANPIAGAGRGERAAQGLQEALLAAGLRSELKLTRGSGDACRFAAERAPECDLVVSIGGDGTLREILNGLHQDGDELRLCPPVATMPMGTANVLAIDFKLPKKIPGIVEMIRGGVTRELDIAQIGSEGGPKITSFLAIGAGFDAEVVHRLDAARQGPISKLSYIPHVARAVATFRPPALTVTVDGAALEGTYGQIMIANIINYGGILKLDPATQSDDGFWELYLWRKGNRRELMRSAIRGAIAHLPGGPCTRVRAKKIQISSTSPFPYHVDGDPGGFTPFEFEVTGRRQAILVPRS